MLSAVSITDNAIAWPSSQELWRALSLADYNTRVVVIGATLLGVAAGIIGTFAYLRKRAMLGDALSHATLPGIAIAFLISGEKNLSLLLLGATTTGVLGILAVVAMRKIPRIKEDAAIGIVLSVFFGIGMVLFSLIQQTDTGNAAGLTSFIYGKAAAMIARDAILIGVSAAAILIGCALLYKEFRLICFDKSFAAAQGWPVAAIDLAMMAMVVCVTVVGLQAVGLIMIVALLIIPAAAARFWTDRLSTMTLIAGTFGAISGYLGSTISALTPRLPTGAVIVIVTGILFFASMFFSPHRGVLASVIRQWALSRRIAFQHLLRAMAEHEESGHTSPATFEAVFVKRSWTRSALTRLIRRATSGGLLDRAALPALRLTSAGRDNATRILRNHRLWEMYLIRYADIAPSHVDRDADEVEHVLAGDVVRDLEQALNSKDEIAPSPHPTEQPV